MRAAGPTIIFQQVKVFHESNSFSTFEIDPKNEENFPLKVLNIFLKMIPTSVPVLDKVQLLSLNAGPWT